MNLHQLSIGFVTAALIAAQALSAAWRPPVSGDVNGDRRLDILDLQAISASLAAPSPASSPSADMNDDGLVDILDYQRLLNHAADGTLPESDESPLPQIASTAPCVLLVPQTAIHAAVVTSDLNPTPASSADGERISVRNLAPVPIQGGLFIHAAHAPPRLG